MKYLSPKVMPLEEELYYLYNLPVLVVNKHNLQAEKHGGEGLHGAVGDPSRSRTSGVRLNGKTPSATDLPMLASKRVATYQALFNGR